MAATVVVISFFGLGVSGTSSQNPVSLSIDLLFSRFSSADAASQESSKARLEQLEDSISALEHNPLGEGLGTQSGTTLRFGIEQTVTDIYFALMALEMGIPGLILLLSVISALVWLFLKIRRIKLYSVAGFFAASVMFVIVSGALSSSLDSPVLSAPLWIVLGVELSGIKASPSASSIGRLEDSGDSV